MGALPPPPTPSSARGVRGAGVPVASLTGESRPQGPAPHPSSHSDLKVISGRGESSCSGLLRISGSPRGSTAPQITPNAIPQEGDVEPAARARGRDAGPGWPHARCWEHLPQKPARRSPEPPAF